MVVQFIAVAIWCFGYGFELISPTLAAKLFWAKFEYTGIVAVPVAWFLFILEYSGNKHRLKQQIRHLLWLEPCLTLILVWTNDLHGLIWQKEWLGQLSSTSILLLNHGAWFGFHTVYSYTLLLASSIITVSLVKRFTFKVPDSFALLASVLVPWIGNGAYVLGISPFPGLDPTPFAFAFSSLVMAWGVFHLRILEISPMAHEIAISNMAELMFVLDEHGCIIDANPSAQAAFNLSSSFKNKILLANLLNYNLDSHEEWSLPPGEIPAPTIISHNGCEYEMLQSPLLNPRNQPIGQLVLLHDVTYHRQIERRLQLQFDVSRILVGVSDGNVAARSILELICTNIGFEWGGIWEVDDHPQQMHLQHQWPAPDQTRAEKPTTPVDEIKPGEGILGAVWQNQVAQWLFAENFESDCALCEFAETNNWQVGLVVPIILVKSTLGVMAFFSNAVPQQTKLESLFSSLGSQIGQFMERQNTEKALRDSQSKYKSLTDQLPVGLYRTKGDGTILHLNQALATILGYDRPEDVIQKVNAKDLYENPADRDQLNELWKKEEQTSSAVIPFHDCNGKRLWLRDTGRVFLNPYGEIDYIDGIIEDITDRKNAEDSLRDSEQRYRELFHASLAQARELGLIIEVRTSLARELELEAVFTSIVSAVANTYGYKNVSLYFLKGDNFELQSKVGHSQRSEVVPTDEGVIGGVFQTGQSVLTTHQPEKSSDLETGSVEISEIAIPLYDRGHIVGVLVVEANENKSLDDNDLRILNEVSQHVSMAIERAIIFSESKDSEQKLRNVIEHSLDGIMLSDEQGSIIEWNQGQERITGIPRENALNKKIWELENLLPVVSAKDYEDFHVTYDFYKSTLKGLYATEKNYLELNIKRPDGEIRNLQIVISPIQTAKGIMESSITRDVTESRRGEENLRRRDEILDAIAFASSQFLNAPLWEDCIQSVLGDLAKATHCDRVYLFQNQIDMSGLVGKQRFMWQTPAFPDQVCDEPLDTLHYLELDLNHMVVEFAEGRCIYGPTSSLSSNERKVFQNRGVLSIALIPIFIEMTWWGWIGIEDCHSERDWTVSEIESLKIAADILGTDIQRSEAERSLRQSETRNKAMLNAIPDRMYRFTRDGTITADNSANPDTNYVGFNISMLLSPEYLDQALQKIELAFHTKEVQMLMFERAASPSDLRSYEARLVVCGENEILAIIRDISERARLEQMKSDFINRAAHDLRTPLTSIIMMSDLIHEGGEEEELEQYWQILQSELKRERTLIEKLLSVGRLESGRYQINKLKVDIHSALENSLDTVRSLASSTSITVTESVPEELPAVLADLSSLEQVFVNLLNNAIKFTPNHGSVWIMVKPDDRGIEIEISDTGIGIPPADLPNLFQRFYRASNAIEEEIQGTGVGLFIVKSIVEQHEGHISVTSELGKGTTMKVWLPVAPQTVLA